MVIIVVIIKMIRMMTIMLMMMMMIFSHENIVTGGERNADEDEKEIGDREV